MAGFLLYIPQAPKRMRVKYNSQSTYNILRLLTLALIAAFVLCGIWGRTVAKCLTVNGNSAFASSDRIFADTLQVNDASERIVDSLSDVPRRRPLALLIPAAMGYGPLFEVAISAIVWPHQIDLIPVKNSNVKRAVDALRHTRFGAALVFGVDPPASNSGTRHVGPLTIIPESR
jgi:hypothetical protein